jgi:hypothetical protein
MKRSGSAYLSRKLDKPLSHPPVSIQCIGEGEGSRVRDFGFPIFDLAESVPHCVDLCRLVIVHTRVRRRMKRSGSAYLSRELDKPLWEQG